MRVQVLHLLRSELNVGLIFEDQVKKEGKVMRVILGAIFGLVVGTVLTQDPMGAIIGAAIGAWLFAAARGGPSGPPPANHPWWDSRR
jgi:hypothetical protein